MQSDIGTCRALSGKRITARGANSKLKKVFNNNRRLSSYPAVLVGKYIYVEDKKAAFASKDDANFRVAYLDIKTWKWRQWDLESEVLETPYLTSTALVGDKIYRFGGMMRNRWNYRKMHVLDLPMQSLTMTSSAGDDLMPLRRSAAVFMESVDMIIAFGGAHDVGNPVPTNWLVGYKVDKNEWTVLHAKGAAPSRRIDHSCCTHGKHDIFVFGGRDDGGPVPADLFKLFCYNESYTWTRIMLACSPRVQHSMCCVGNRVFVFGGYRTFDVEPTDDLIIYDVNKRACLPIYRNERSPLGHAGSVSLKGELKANAGHAAVGSNRMIVFLSGIYLANWAYTITCADS